MAEDLDGLLGRGHQQPAPRPERAEQQVGERAVGRHELPERRIGNAADPAGFDHARRQQ